MSEQAREGTETAKEARKRVLDLFKAFHPDRGDTPLNQSASRLLSSVLTKISDNPKTQFAQLRWDRREEAMIRAGITFTKTTGETYAWSPATPAALIQALESYSKGVLPTEQVAASPTERAPLFEYDDTFAKTEGDREKTPPSPEELADVLFYANTLSEIYNIKFVVQPRMYEYDWFIRNARSALSQLNTFFKEQTPEQRHAYAGVTVELIGYMSHFKIAFLPDAVREALIQPGTDGAAWESALKFSINPAALKWERFELEGPDARGGFFGREFAQKSLKIGFEPRLKGTPDDVKEIQEWLADTYGFVGIDVPDVMAARKDDPEVRLKAFTMLAFVARALKEAQYGIVEEGNPPDEKRIRKEIFSQAEIRAALEGGYIVLGVGDDRDGTSAYARETKDGVCVYAHEKLDSLWLIGNIQGIVRKKKEADASRAASTQQLPNKGTE